MPEQTPGSAATIRGQLPEWLDYEEGSTDDGETFPIVYCRTPKCGWTQWSRWDALDSSEPDAPYWDLEHPRHD